MPFAFLVPKYFSIICTNRKDARFTKFGKETFEETKGIIRNRQLKKDRQYNGQTIIINTILSINGNFREGNPKVVKVL
jgi:hypothetical protein